jgi:hypothetical protein
MNSVFVLKYHQQCDQPLKLLIANYHVQKVPRLLVVQIVES